jgi:hypothetical protein
VGSLVDCLWVSGVSRGRFLYSTLVHDVAVCSGNAGKVLSYSGSLSGLVGVDVVV